VRLFVILSTTAKYRLQEFARHTPASIWLTLILLPFSIRWIFSSHHTAPLEVRARLALEELGPIYIKLGQLISTRRDFLDPILADELANLQDNVPPFSTPSIHQILTQELGSNALSFFKEIDPTPLASASVAQVYLATLISNDEVVIKVVRPGIEALIKSDLKVLKWLAHLVDNNLAIGKRLRPIEVIEDYEHIILDELNLQMEAANTVQLRRNFEHSESLYVPKIYWDYVSENVMVAERIHGIPVSDITSLKAHGIDFKRLAEIGVEIFFTQVFEHNFFHADMHPGNIFVSKETPLSPRYIAIDCAIIGSLTESDQEYLAKNLLAIFKRQYRKVAELHVSCGWVPANTNVSEFESAIRSVCEPIFEKPLKDISFAAILIQLFRTAGRFNMEVQPSLVLLQKTLLNVEGLGRQLYPDLDLWQTALPFLEKWQTKRHSPLVVLNKIKDNLPELIEQLPQAPLLIAEALTRQKETTAALAKLQDELAQRDSGQQKARSVSIKAGVLALLLAAVSLLPEANHLLAQIPLATGLLGLAGVYLLCFRR
jgi:ubiquinone biosynthesis protein